MADRINMAQTELVAVAGTPAQFLRTELPQIAISGRSNVGKSSMINTLLGRKALARVSSSPGKTITVNYYLVDKRFYLVDLPGYGFAKRSPDEKRRLSQLGDGYFQTGAPCVTLQLVDMKVGPTSDDMLMLDWLARTGMDFVIVATKADKLNRTERAAALKRIPVQEDRVIPFSSLNGEGKDRLTSIILRYAGITE